MKQKPLIIAVTLLATLFLTSCGSLSSHFGLTHHADVRFNQLDETPEHYLEQAASAKPPEQQMYQLMAVRRLLQDRQIQRARLLLKQVSVNGLPRKVIVERYLLIARVQLLRNNPNAALAMLQKVHAKPTWPLKSRIDQQELFALAYAKQGNHFASIKHRIQLNALLTEHDARENNQLAIWNSIQQLSPAEINAYLQQPVSETMRGWLQFASITRGSTDSSQQFAQQIKQWQEKHFDHPANMMLPHTISAESAQAPAQPKQVALLLPLHGKLAEKGRAIHNGFLAAYYNAKQNGEPTPKINVLDTTKDTVVHLYKKAAADGADFIVGPLTKTNVQELANAHSLPITTLALNTVDGHQRTTTNLYQFGLSPRDEAQQAAQKAWKDGYEKVMIIAPAGAWGEGIADAFAFRWQQLGGKIVSRWDYPAKGDLSKPLKQILGISKSQERADTLKTLLSKDFKFTPQRRADIDFIFLVALPARARAIRPLLKFYYAGGIPIYATSTIFNGTTKGLSDHDLDKIQFCDMPWVLNPPDQLSANLRATRAKIISLWPKSFQRHAKLYGLGIDAYRLVTQLNRLMIFPQLGVSGATGVLHLDPYQHIYRQLQWKQIKAGA